MKIKDAVAQRIIDLCKEKNIAIKRARQHKRRKSVHDLQHTEHKKSKSRRCNAAKNMRRLGNINTGFF